MSLTLLQLVQQASNEMGLASPSSVVGNTTADIVQLYALSNALGNELQREFPWNALEKEYRFYTTAITVNGTLILGSTAVTLGTAQTLDTTYMVTGTGINQDTYVAASSSGTSATISQQATQTGTFSLTFSKTKYAMPADYDRMQDKTQWDKTRHWEMLGPLTAQQWQFLKSGFISTGPRVRYRIMGNFFQIWPVVQNNEYLGFEYLSNQWALDNTSAGKAQFSADTDTSIFPDRLMVLGVKLKYFEVKGFDTTAIYRDFSAELDRAKANNQGGANLSFAPRVNNILIGWDNIPDSSYGS